MSKPIFYLDLDGVCADFTGGVMKLFGHDPSEQQRLPDWGIESYFDLSEDEFWNKIYLQGPEWWRNLEEYPWFNKLYALLKSKGDVYFVSCPSHDPLCTSGKMQWLQDRFGKNFRNYVFTSKKYLLAPSGGILIDDSEKKCLKYWQAKGRYILFPQPWNMDRKYVNKGRVARVKSTLMFYEELCGGLK